MPALADRLAAIRLPVNRLAERARLSRSCVDKFLQGRVDPLRSTERALANAIEAEERALLDHLVRLHPDAAREALEAA